MKNYLIAGLVCLLAALVFGVEPVQRVTNEMAQRGTLKGVENCMSYSSSDLLPEEAIRTACARALQKRLYHTDHATGRAGPRLNEESVSWSGNLENKIPDHVTTWIRIAVSIFDEEGTEQEHVSETSLWIPPMGEAEFRVDLPELEREQVEGIEFCDYDDSTPKTCMTWGIVGVMGLKI